MKWKSVALLVSLSASMMLVACQTTKTNFAGISKAPFCSLVDPIRYSRNDTQLTQQQVRELNAIWVKLCRGKP